MKKRPKQTDRVELRVSIAEKRAYERAAEADERTLSNWARRVLNKAVKAPR
jgi:uncharacterized protein (DUF1778 family)